MSDTRDSFGRLLAEALLSVAMTVAVALIVHRWLSLANLAFLFLVPVIAMAGKRGLAGGLVSALLATLGFNFLFVPPSYTFHVADVDNLVTLFVLALSAVLVSHFAARLKAQAHKAEAMAQDSERLASLTQALAACTGEEQVRAATIDTIESWTGANMKWIDPDVDAALSPLDNAAARWAQAHQDEAGRGTEVMAGADALYLPLGRKADRYVAQFWRGGAGAALSTDQRELVRQALVRYETAIHRVTVEARLHYEEMREAVLASIGHDLRTPLTGIVAGLAALAPDEGGIVETSRAEAARLDALVTNILDLARLRADALTEVREALDLTDAVDAVLTSLASRLAGYRVIVDLPADLLLVRSDARILHHMLLNLIDNAAKFSRPGSIIRIEGHRQLGVSLLILDEGRGLETTGDGVPRRNPAEVVPGSGLGLKVVNGFAQALGIVFSARNRMDGERGAQMTLTFPPALCIATGTA